MVADATYLTKNVVHYCGLGYSSRHWLSQTYVVGFKNGPRPTKDFRYFVGRVSNPTEFIPF